MTEVATQQQQPQQQLPKATLKSFQAEIERIAQVKQAEAIKLAKEAHAAAELARHHGKKREAVVKEINENEHMHETVEEVPELPIEVGPPPIRVVLCGSSRSGN